MNYESIIRLVLIIAIVLEFSSLIASFKNIRWASSFFWMAWLICAGLFTLNWQLAQAPPVGNMYHVMSFLPLIMGPLYCYVARVRRGSWLLGYFAATGMLALIGALCMPMQANWSRMPALQSAWFVPHVAAYILSYSLATVATLLVIVSQFKEQEERRFMEAAHEMILLAFPFMTFGLWSGALWADEVWGGYWSWDIKEVWSLITWGGYLIYFHMRKIADWRKYLPQLLFATYIALLITFFIVNLLPKITSMHSYAS